MNKVILLTGGNIGNRNAMIQEARQAIEYAIGTLTEVSPIIESAAWGFKSDQAFLNQVVVVETNDTAFEVLDKVQKIELNLGRARKQEQWVSRIIDIDILFFNDEIIKTERLTVPHMHIQDRRFTLYALNIIDPNFVHPVFKMAIQELLHRCDDKSEVEVYFE